MLDEAKTYYMDRIEEAEDFEVDFGRYTKEGSPF
jgi:hypothetical protein